MGAAALGFCLTGLESDKHELRRLARLRPGAWTNAEEDLPGPWLTLDEAGLELWAKDPLRVEQSFNWDQVAELEVDCQLATDMGMDERPRDLPTAAVAELRGRTVAHGVRSVLRARVQADQAAVLAQEVERCRAAASPAAAAGTVATPGAGTGLAGGSKQPKRHGPRRRRRLIQWPICPSKGEVRWLTLGLMVGLTAAGVAYYRSDWRGTALALFGGAGLALALFIGASMLLRPTTEEPLWRKVVAVVLAPSLFAVGLFGPLTVAQRPTAIGLPEDWAAPGPRHYFYNSDGQQMEEWTVEGDEEAVGTDYLSSDLNPRYWLGKVIPPGDEADVALYREAIQNTVDLLEPEHPDAGQHLAFLGLCGVNTPPRTRKHAMLFCGYASVVDGDHYFAYDIYINSDRNGLYFAPDLSYEIDSTEVVFTQDQVDAGAIASLVAACNELGPNAYPPLIWIYYQVVPGQFTYLVTCEVDDQTRYDLRVNQWLTVYKAYYKGPAQ
jgi:hypothetical protein